LQVALFFKRIKQHLRLRAFPGTAEHVAMAQVWIGVSVPVLVAIVRKRLGSDGSLCETSQIVSLTMFEATPLHHLLSARPPVEIL
jgi:hypothetical protein